jgi:hypothetical protein
MATISTALGEIAAGGREALQGGAVREGERGRKEDEMDSVLVLDLESLSIRVERPAISHLQAVAFCRGFNRGDWSDRLWAVAVPQEVASTTKTPTKAAPAQPCDLSP